MTDYGSLFYLNMFFIWTNFTDSQVTFYTFDLFSIYIRDQLAKYFYISNPDLANFLSELIPFKEKVFILLIVCRNFL